MNENWLARREREYWEKLAPAEAEYERVKEILDPEEKARIAELREQRKAGDESAYYGHDLFAAIRRAERRAKINQARDFYRSAGLNAKPNIFAAIGMLVTAAIEEGVDPEKIKRALRTELENKDSTSIDKQHERWKNAQS